MRERVTCNHVAHSRVVFQRALSGVLTQTRFCECVMSVSSQVHENVTVESFETLENVIAWLLLNP